MKTSGVFKVNNIRFDEEEEDGERAILMVHDIRPPFLVGKKFYTDKTDKIEIVKDVNSDMAKFAKQGSAVLRHTRDRNDRSKMRERFWELAGSKLGALLGV
jgi:pre-mRNA-splicing factor ATP-dependent RNA helicase DHX38/PRP16